ncbi:hypothetical protein BGX38DRAFT_1085844 [Terfezia claveryi]|nr:hypothetical protein BGX38DRAFT_1085844 [Terfezia claveryi]
MGPAVYRTGEISQTHDPRTLTTQSIVTIQPPQFPPQSQQLHLINPQSSLSSFGPKKRKLLLIYIHGFLGSTTSFNQFPKHLHTLLACLLSTSCPQYTVHTKIYPRFKTRHPIGEAAEMLSEWLSEFEDEDETDVILLGHSMGGLLAGEIVLLPRLHPTDNDPRRYRHRILGLVGFDTPFLGMHPGVVASGISSLFRPSPKPDKRKETTSMSPTAYEEGPSAEDLVLRKKPEHFDTGLAPRSDSGNRGIRNFLTKHSGNIPGATMQYVMSHMEFAACLAEPMGLSTRYRRLRGLEDGKELSAPGGNAGIGGYRVRFVNYYTVCYGRDKEKEKEKEQEKEREEKHLDINGISPPSTPGEGTPRSSTSTPPPLPPPHIIPVVPRNQGDQMPPLPQSPQQPEAPQDPLAILNARSQRYSLPPIPPRPVPPPLHEDLSHITDQKLQKLHMKENKQLWKEHWRREKVHSKLIKDREKVLHKLDGKVAECPKPTPSKEKDVKGCEKAEKLKTEKEKMKKERKERKFCLVPKEAKGGEGLREDVGGGEVRDETWVKVPMGNVDEVGAHCGLFMAGAEIFETPRAEKPQEKGAAWGSSDVQYERLVGDLAERIEGWVKEHVGGLQAMEVAGQGLSQGSVDHKWLE